MTAVRSALVVGAGVAGPAVAMALRKAGIDATVYEARPRDADGAGAFLTLASNGIDALRQLDAHEPALAAGFATPTITLRSTTGKRLGGSRTGGTLADRTTGHTLKRADLHRVLRDEAVARGIAVEHGKRLVEAHPTAQGVRVVFADGSEVAGDVLIGCDGVHSAVRRIVDSAAPSPTYVGLLGTGGFTAGVTVDSTPGDYEMLFGKRAFFGYVHAPGGEVWWFANVPQRQEPTRDAPVDLDGERWRPRLIELFGDDAGPAVELIRRSPEVLPLSPVHSVPHLPRWHRDRMVVLGDAAHAPSPSSGQGASLAIEDALVLALCLRDEASPDAAFARFEALRRARVERIIRSAARTNSAKAAGPVGRVLRDALLPLVIRLTADGKAHREVYDHRIAWEEPVRARA